MRKILAFALAVLTLCTATSFAAGAQYVEPAEFRKWLVSGKKMQIVDIQLPAEFRKHSFQGAIQTNAFPVKSAEEKQRLDAVLPKLSSGREDIVVVCPRGGGGAKNTANHLIEKGIAPQRIYILADGMLGWPYQELVVSAAK